MYCQPQTRSPSACSASTIARLNCDQTLRPSALLTNTVEMPSARARAAIAARLPPSLRDSSQIHMPPPWKAAGTDAAAAAPPRSPAGRRRASTFSRRPLERR